ncbi:MAG: hypothetical protein H7210_05765 [Pyrinomonadaceae bacterium]|nr:hypothetical protein [Phycisphaerales bacterium]
MSRLSMNRLSPRRLAAINATLLCALVVLCLAPIPGQAAPQPERARGNYTMVSGRVQGSNTHGLYLLDAANQELVALRWEIGRNGLVTIGYRSLTADAKATKGTR